MRKVVFIFSLIMCLCLLSSCGNKNQFMYDNAISWNSTKDDIIRKYGTNYEKNEYDDFLICYDNYNVCGFPDFRVEFYTDVETGKLDRIFITGVFPSEKGEIVLSSILNGLTEKYGEPSVGSLYENKLYSFDLKDVETIISLRKNLPSPGEKLYIELLYYENKPNQAQPTNGL